MLYDFLEHNMGLTLILEYVAGETGESFIRKYPNGVPKDLCIKYFLQILDGFEYAHSKGVIHRDIKPSNFIITKEGNVKILDFGIAKILKGDSRITRVGTKMGSLLYMSPEQILGRDSDIRTDIYSLGVTLYEMLNGSHPYEKLNSDYEIQYQIVNNPIQPFRRLFARSQELYGIILKATEKDPAMRFNSCIEFSDALKRLNQTSASGNLMSEPVYAANQRTVIMNSGTDKYYSKQVSKKKNNKYNFAAAISIIAIAIFVLVVLILQNRDDKTVTTSVDKDKTDETKLPQTKSKESNISVNNENVKKEISLIVDEMLNAWQNKDVNGFFNHLTLDYEYQSADGIHRNYDERLKKAYQIFAANSFILMKKSNLQIDVNGDEAVAKFNQSYNSTTVNEKTTKQFYFRKKGSKWMVYKELSGF
jgi:serine/threonine protein kinase